MYCRRGIVLQASTALSNPPPSAETSPVAAEQAVPLLQLEQNIQAMRAVVQAQHTQLQSLQALKQSQPLVGLTTDQPWGMALEGLTMGLVALVCGGGALLALRTLPLRRRAHPVVPAAPGPEEPPAFSDSMLYLADQDDAQEVLPPVATYQHDPQHDAKASTLAHEEGDPALEYHRMALTAQGLSVTAGAGRIDSDRIPLESPPPAEKEAHSIFSPSLSRAEFDQRAAEEEVERVRRYLAQRRADRMHAAAPVQEFSPVDVAARQQADVGGPSLALLDVPLDLDSAPPGGWDSLELTPLSEGASLLAALSEEVRESAPTSASVHGEGAGEDMPALPSADVQLALAQEFHDLGLWDEARARLQEVLDLPDDGQHAQAKALLKEWTPMAATSPPDMLLEASPSHWGSTDIDQSPGGAVD